VTEKLSRKIYIVRCDFAIKQRFLLIFFALQQQTNTFLADVNVHVVVGTSPPIIFARLVRPMNALQLCRWQLSHKKTL